MSRFDPPGGKPWGLLGLCGASLLLNVALGTRLLLMPEPPPAPARLIQAPTTTTAAIAAVETSVPVEPATTVEGPAQKMTKALTEPDDSTQDPDDVQLPEDVRVHHLEVHHSLARTFAEGVPGEGRFLSAIFSRLFAFDLDLRRDIQKGDQLDVAWRGRGPNATILAARYVSKKRGTLTAYRYQPAGARYPRWYDAEGRDVSRELLNSPIEDYEQITSLLHDRPTHRGMDFKAPVGTPVLAGADGTVTRVDWNTRANGRCIEVRYTDGTVAKYLHLSQIDVEPGQRVPRGARLGLSGNTGRSTAPHLHYELARGGKVVDPIDYHGVHRPRIPTEERASFDAVVTRMNAWLDAG